MRMCTGRNRKRRSKVKYLNQVPTSAENSYKRKQQYKNAIQTLDYTAIADR